MLKDKHIIIIGGSSGIGIETARLALLQGARVTIASRSEEKLRKAKAKLDGNVTSYILDSTQETEVKDFFETVGPLDHLIVTAAETSGGAFLTTDTAQDRQMFENKFWGQYYVAKYGALKILPKGSITLFSGVVAFKAMVGSAILGAINAAVANLGKTLALELAPIRVNVVSPGIIDTPARSKMPADMRDSFYNGVANKLPVQRIGQAEDVAKGVLYLVTNGFVTGTVLHMDGGHSII
ncbi:MAG: hypothetical protein K0R78_594 [Pelosinus sp.]|jgi:NAD(P)-dependent dehydrogenase (short-subunit alcohol dehydrogenase family)|nr:hypothetical protein [Pelosinus sp.]